MAGNPNFIAVGWGETTKAVKLPVRICERIQELRDDGQTADDILGLLDEDNQTDSLPEISSEDLEEAIAILQTALALKANAGGKIKAEVRRALELLGAEEE